MNERGRLTTLDALRGVASLAVAWFHLSHEMGFVPRGSLLYRSGTYGWVGVEVFFVISGFVIPFALDREGYRMSQYGRFLAKRVIRLEPPYLIAILLSLAIAAYYAWASHSRFPFTLPQILLHLGYLNAFVGFPWVNPVFWTLAIEFQYYLLIGLVFPLVSDRRAFWLLLVPSCLLLAFAVKNEAMIFRYLPFFLFGLIAFQFRRRELSRVVFVCCAALFTYVAWRTTGLFPALAGGATACAIGFVNRAPRTIVALGSISYSLYLVHAPIGYTTASIIARRFSAVTPFGLVFISLCTCLIAACLMYAAIERPSRHLAARIGYRAGT